MGRARVWRRHLAPGLRAASPDVFPLGSAHHRHVATTVEGGDAAPQVEGDGRGAGHTPG